MPEIVDFTVCAGCAEYRRGKQTWDCYEEPCCRADAWETGDCPYIEEQIHQAVIQGDLENENGCFTDSVWLAVFGGYPGIDPGSAPYWWVPVNGKPEPYKSAAAIYRALCL